MRYRTLGARPLRLVGGEIALIVIGLFCGASIGREGPTVQVRASLMLQTARWGGMALARGLILAGFAAGSPPPQYTACRHRLRHRGVGPGP